MTDTLEWKYWSGSIGMRESVPVESRSGVYAPGPGVCPPVCILVVPAWTTAVVLATGSQLQPLAVSVLVQWESHRNATGRPARPRSVESSIGPVNCHCRLALRRGQRFDSSGKLKVSRSLPAGGSSNQNRLIFSSTVNPLCSE